MSIIKLLISVLPLLAASCSSLKPYPTDDKHSNHRWLELGGGGFESTSRTVITDDTMVQESYQRANWGRNEGSHLITEQHIDALPPAAAQRFWTKIDQLTLFQWSGRDMPPLTKSTWMSYRKGDQFIRLSDLQNPRKHNPKASDEPETYPRQEALGRAIRELEKEATAAGEPTS